MKWTIHPNLRQAAALAAIGWTFTAFGCTNQSGGAVNPFLAPDRVPPPATRAILPGQAQPYYPGDPLPVMQSAAPTPSNDSFDTLAQNAPAWVAPAATTAADSRSPMSIDAASTALAFSNEPTVAIPKDNGELRFELPPAPGPAPVTPMLAAQAPQQLAPLAAAPERAEVVPASYTEPVITGPLAGTDEYSISGDEPIVAGPWRSPHIAAPAQEQPIIAAPSGFASAPPVATSVSPIVYGGAPPMFSGVAPSAPQANTMGVRLRAVPSPPLEAVESNTPRIRLPGYAPPQPWTGSSTVMHPIAGSVVQTAAIGPMAPPHDPSNHLADAPGAALTGDGFRPRSSMR